MKSAPRFVVSGAAVEGALARVTGVELHHMRDVMRLRVGSPVAILDQRGLEYRGRIKRFAPSHALVEVQSQANRAPSHRLILAAAIIKGPRMDLMVEKAAELGTSEFWPLICARGLVREPGPQRLARWRRLALAAAKQSLAPGTMEVLAPRDFAQLSEAVPPGALAIVCRLGAPPLAPILRAAAGAASAVVLACGPEGDFDPDEAARAERAGFRPAGLGPNRLRSETAAIAALSVAAAVLDEISQGA